MWVLFLFCLAELPDALSALPSEHERVAKAYADGPLKLVYEARRANSPPARITIFAQDGAILVEKEGSNALIRRYGAGLGFTLTAHAPNKWLVAELSRSDAPFHPAPHLYSLAPPVTAPFASFDISICELFSDKLLTIDGVSEQVGTDGQKEVQVSWTRPPMVGRTVFLPDRHWVVTRHERTPDWKKGFSRRSVEYADQEVRGVPLVVKYRDESLPAGQDAVVLEEFELVEMSLEIPRNRVELSWYGLPDDLGQPPSPRWPYAVVASVAALLLLAAIGVWRGRSR